MKFLRSLFNKKHEEKGNPFERLPLYKNQYADTPVAPMDYPKCSCFQEYYEWENRFYSEQAADAPVVWSESILHVDESLCSQRAWGIVCEIFDSAKKKGVKELNLGKIMDRSDFKALNSLPETIGELKDLETFILYGSNLSSIPREIGGCENLKSFQPYTSYRLHWLPYEIKRCRNLTDSCISTRALYGNYKMRPPFPDLSASRWEWRTGSEYCSVCGTDAKDLEQYWISQAIATDVVPLLVSVCSKKCLGMVDKNAQNYVQGPHKGGLSLKQPKANWMGM